MKTHGNEVASGNEIINAKSKLVKWFLRLLLFILPLLLFSTKVTLAHCDTMDGPVIKDARTAIEKNNVNYILKWIQPENEDELKAAFSLSLKVRGLSPEAKTLADKYLFETLVRLHRNGEGLPYTGVKPSGTPVDDKILAADKSIEIGNLLPLKDKISEEMLPELTERFKKVMSLRNYDVNNVKAGREYVESYVRFFKFAEGETEEGHHHMDAGTETKAIHLQ